LRRFVMVHVTERVKRRLKELAGTKLGRSDTAPRLIVAGTGTFGLVADRESEGDQRVEHEGRVARWEHARLGRGCSACRGPVPVVEVTIVAPPDQGRHVGAFIRTLAALGMVALVAAGCQSLAGRPAGQYLQDKALHARVKARLGAASPCSRR
jgi:hypothetical protein